MSDTNRGLYELHNQLEKYVSSKDKIGYIIGLCVVEGSFLPKEKRINAKKFRETKQIYDSMINALKRVEVEEINELIYSMQSTLMPKVYDSLKKPQNPKKSEISSGILKLLRLKKQSPEDIIKNAGLELIIKITETGNSKNKRDSLSKDKKNIRYCFTREKGDRR